MSNNNLANLFGKMSFKNRAHSPVAAAAAASRNNANNLANLFGSTMKVTRRRNPYGSTRRKKPMSGHSNSSHRRATRSAVKSGKASLVQGLQNAKKKSTRAVKMAVNAANQAQRAASLAAQASAQVQAASAAASNAPIVFPNFHQSSAALFGAYPPHMSGPSRYGKKSYKRHGRK